MREKVPGPDQVSRTIPERYLAYFNIAALIISADCGYSNAPAERGSIAVGTLPCCLVRQLYRVY